jgi:hypothetical protein
MTAPYAFAYRSMSYFKTIHWIVVVMNLMCHCIKHNPHPHKLALCKHEVWLMQTCLTPVMAPRIVFLSATASSQPARIAIKVAVLRTCL